MARLGVYERGAGVLDHEARRDLLRLSTMGSVDDGKSTLIGRLLHDTKSIYEDRLAVLRADSARVGSGPALDFALLTDGLKAEREQGITIDVAYRYFSTPRRTVIIADTPGHEQYTRNMATGASTADLAVILIDARHGVLTQSKRHSFIAVLLGIPRLVIAVNKMDLVGYSEQVFDRIAREYTDFASRLGVADLTFIPVSALGGDNVVAGSASMPWYHGESVLEHLETVSIDGDRNLVDFRLPVQYVIRSHQGPRAYAGQLASGILRHGEEVLVLPSMRRTRVQSISGPEGETDCAFAPMSIAVALDDELDISRGDMLVHPNNRPAAQSTFEAMVVWMAEAPMRAGRPYLVKHTTRSAKAVVERVEYRVDVDTLGHSPAGALGLNEIGRLVLQSTEKLFLDAYERNRVTGSLILIDPLSNDTVAAGMVIDPLRQPELHLTWDRLAAPGSERRDDGRPVSAGDRERLLGQRALTIWLTGLDVAAISSIARELRRRLQAAGRHAYVLDGDDLQGGLNRDLTASTEDRSEGLRRAAEVARLFSDAGTIALVPTIAPSREDREVARRIIGAERFFEVYVSASIATREGTGLTSAYEPPGNPSLVIDTGREPLSQSVDRLWRALEG